MGSQNYASKRYIILTFTGIALFLMILHYSSAPPHTVVRMGKSKGQSNHLGQSHRSDQYAIYVSNLRTCLDASNLTRHFNQEDLRKTAVSNMRYYVKALRKFIPNQFITTLPNHCWNADVKLDLSFSLVSGHVNGTQFSVKRSDIDHRKPLITFPPSAGTKYRRHHFLPLSCIPEVFLLGFFKCGTSYFYCLLTSHPAVSRTIRKEPKFFNKLKATNDSIFAMYFADYLVNYESLVHNDRVTGDLSVDGTVGMMTTWPVFHGQQNIINYCLLPSVIPEILPKAKFIVVMREPVSMLYSLFWFSCTFENRPVPSREAQLKGPDIFHERIVARIHHFESCLTMFPLAKCIAESSTIREPFHPLMAKCGVTKMYRAFYYIHILKWLSVVPRERFLFLTLEELSSTLHQTANVVWKFIGLNPLDLKSYSECNGRNEQRKVNYKNDPRLAMRNDTKEILRSFFRPYNQMLADLLGDRKYLWNQAYA